MRIIQLRLLLLSLVLAAAAGCKDLMDNGRESDAEVMGTTRSILDGRGNYAAFLQAIERAGYGRLLDGGGLVTVFAPADDVFLPYLEEKFGTRDIASIDAQQLAVVIGYHLIQFSYTRADFLAFSTTSSEDRPAEGDGSCYKYKTYAREPVEHFTDPVTRRRVNLFSREKYLPVFSTRIFANRDIADPEGDYRMLFPGVNWHGTDDQLYAGEAYVDPTAIPTDNGYLYLVDKALDPLPTIYKKLHEPAMDDYSVLASLFERFNRYTYNANLSTAYASPGDSLYLFYTFKNPQAVSELPEIASEWGYHDESGALFDRALRYSTTLFAPNDQALETFLKEYFAAWGTLSTDDYLSLIPNNAVYHLLMAHNYGQRDLILPSQLDAAPVVGANGERFQIAKTELTGAEMCTNGVIYGIERTLVPATFTCLTMPLFKYPQFKFFSLAFNTKNMYLQTADRNNRFTLFVLDDTDMAALGFNCSEVAGDWGNYTFRNSAGNMGANPVSNLMMQHFCYGDVPDPRDSETTRDLRYFVAKDGITYFFMRDGQLYNHNAAGDPYVIKQVFETENGRVYQLNKVLTRNTNGIMSHITNAGDYSIFRTMMTNAGLMSGSAIGSWMANSMVFLPANAAINQGVADGRVPKYTTPLTAEELQALRDYVRYHFVPISKNRLPHYILPGLGPNGSTNDAWQMRLATFVESASDAGIRHITMDWDPADPGRVKLTDLGGNVLYTVDGDNPAQMNNAMIYHLNECFDQRTMYGN